MAVAVGWLHKALYRTVLEPKVLAAAASKLLKDVPDFKRSGT